MCLCLVKMASFNDMLFLKENTLALAFELYRLVNEVNKEDTYINSHKAAGSYYCATSHSHCKPHTSHLESINLTHLISSQPLFFLTVLFCS